MPIVFIGLVLGAGGVEDACFVLLLSVFCTFGAGLLFWLPLCWFVGWLLVSMLREFLAVAQRHG
jgi:hypothetical protein